MSVLGRKIWPALTDASQSGLDDGGEPRRYLARATLVAKVARIAVPERAPVAHLRAIATLGAGEPLLAGPVRLARNAAIVGRSKLEFVGAGEPFELGFGVDDGLRVRRTQEQVRETSAVLGTQKVRRTVTLYLSCLGGERRSVEVTERVPVSEVADVEVTIDSGGWTVDPRHGFAHQTVEIAPRETRTLTLAYEIRASSKVAMPF